MNTTSPPSRTRPSRRLAIALLILGAVALLVAVNLARQAAGSPPVSVDLVTLEPADFEVSIVANGLVRAGGRREVAATGSGLVAEVHVSEGQAVREGDPLISLRVTELARAVERARLQWQQADARLAAAELAGEAVRTVEAERQNRALAALALADAEQALADAVIRSPADGTVIRLLPETGQAIAAGSPVAVIGDLTRLEIEAQVDEVDVAGVRPGNEAAVRSAGLPGASFAAAVDSVALEAVAFNQGASTFPVRLGVDNAAGALRPGMNVQVEIVTARRAAALTAPLVTVHERDGQSYVWVARDGAAAEVAVQTGLRSQSAAEITAGLAAGDQVITGPGSALRDLQAGDRVAGRASPLRPPAGVQTEAR